MKSSAELFVFNQQKMQSVRLELKCQDCARSSIKVKCLQSKAMAARTATWKQRGILRC